jgi:hypothetical protein
MNAGFHGGCSPRPTGLRVAGKERGIAPGGGGVAGLVEGRDYRRTQAQAAPELRHAVLLQGRRASRVVFLGFGGQLGSGTVLRGRPHLRESLCLRAVEGVAPRSPACCGLLRCGLSVLVGKFLRGQSWWGSGMGDDGLGWTLGLG